MEVNNRQPGGLDLARRRASSEEAPSGANRQHHLRTRLESQARAEVDASQAAERAEVRAAHTERPDQAPSSDVIELSHTRGAERNSPAHEARLRELSLAFKEGNLNSPERISRAAEKLLLG